MVCGLDYSGSQPFKYRVTCLQKEEEEEEEEEEEVITEFPNV